MKGIKFGYACFVECLVTGTTHSPITVLVISSTFNMEGLNARIIEILPQRISPSTDGDGQR